MKKTILKLFCLCFAGSFFISSANAQANASINVLMQNSGMVNAGETQFLQVNVGNTGPTSSIGVYKVKVQISAPSAIVSIPATGHNLPAGWTINSNNGATMNLSNGTDVIPVGQSRQILIAIQGNTIGGPSTVSGQLSFSNGISPGTAPGTLTGNSTADDNSTSTVQVTDPTPVILSDFNAALINCQPVLNWITQTEINSDRFEIERTNSNSVNWTTTGTVTARGYSSGRFKYSFTDNSLNTASDKVLYRLKMIDRDGSYKYSETIPVSINCRKAAVSVFPNPVQNGKLYVSLTGTKGFTEAALLTVSGQLIFKTQLSNGTNSLNVSKLPGGIYILNITEENGLSQKIKTIIRN